MRIRDVEAIDRGIIPPGGSYENELTLRDIIRHSPFLSLIIVAVGAALIGYSAHGTSGSGYSNAEECAIHAKTDLGARSCYSLYPTAQK